VQNRPEVRSDLVVSLLADQLVTTLLGLADTFLNHRGGPCAVAVHDGNFLQLRVGLAQVVEVIEVDVGDNGGVVLGAEHPVGTRLGDGVIRTAQNDQGQLLSRCHLGQRAGNAGSIGSNHQRNALLVHGFQGGQGALGVGAVVLNNQLQLLAIDTAVGVDFIQGDLHARVVPGSECGKVAGKAVDHTNLDLCHYGHGKGGRSYGGDQAGLQKVGFQFHCSLQNKKKRVRLVTCCCSVSPYRQRKPSEYKSSRGEHQLVYPPQHST